MYNTLKDFAADDRVRLTDGVLHERYRGLCGVVKKTVKRRNMVSVACDNGECYDAFPQNVERLPTSQ